jgi:hypothetical protein
MLIIETSQQTAISPGLRYMGVFKNLPPPYPQIHLQFLAEDRLVILHIKNIASIMYKRRPLSMVYQVALFLGLRTDPSQLMLMEQAKGTQSRHPFPRRTIIRTRTPLTPLKKSGIFAPWIVD